MSLLQVKNIEVGSRKPVHVREAARFILSVPAGVNGARSARGKNLSIDFIFDRPGISAEIFLVRAVREKDAVNVTISIHHKVPDTACRLVVKEVLYDAALSAFTGRIIIDKKAQKTDTFLEHRVLVVGEGTVSRSEPVLQISANDVKASHSATTGRIGKEQVYYLMSRGLSRKEAEDLIVEGFLKI